MLKKVTVLVVVYHFMQAIIFTLFFLVYETISYAQSKRTLHISPQIEELNAGPSIEYLEDKAKTINIEDLINPRKNYLWKSHDSKILNFGMTRSQYWLRFSLQNNSGSNKFLLEIDRNQFDQIEVYSVRDSEFSRLNIDPVGVEFNTDYSKVAQTIIPIHPKNGELIHYYIKVRMEHFPFFMPIKIWQSQAYTEKQSIWFILRGFFYGAVGVMVLYNLFIFLTIRDRTYLYYILYMSSFAMLISIFEGVSYAALWNDNQWFHVRSIPVFMGIVGFFVGLFTKSFLPTKRYTPILHRIILGLIIGGVVLPLSTLFIDHGYGLLIIAALYGSFGFCILLLVSAVIVAKGFTPAIIFLAAYMVNILSVYGYALMAFGLVEPNSFVIYGMHWGSVIQAAIFSVALAAKMKHAQNLSKQKIEDLNSNLEKEVLKQTFELRAQKEMIEKSNKELKTLDSQKTSFFQNISHELRTPLTLIMMPLDEIIESDQSNSLAKVALKNARRLYRLVNQLLDFQKIDSKKFELKFTTIEMKSFIHTCADYFSSYSSSSNKRVEIRISINGTVYQDLSDCSELFFIKGDIDALEKVMFNLLSNAMKYSKDKGIIDIGLEGDTETIHIFVRDEGPGISQDGQKNLFQVFSQVDSSTTRHYEGSGIGLALSKGLIEQMSGKIGVESQLNKGSRFWFDLPRTDKPKKVIDIAIIENKNTLFETLSEYFNKADRNYSIQNITESLKFFIDHESKVLVLDAERYLEDPNNYKNLLQNLPNTYSILRVSEDHKNDILESLDQIPIDETIFDNDWTFLERLPQAIKNSKILSTAEASFDVKSWLLADIQTKDSEISSTASKNQSVGTQSGLILIADDLKDMRTLVANILAKRGFQVECVENGRMAYEKAITISPDLIITDWMMPELSGIDLVKKLKKHPKAHSIPTILLTAKSEEDSKIKSLEAGAVAYLGKPFNEMELINTVQNMLSMKEQEKRIVELNKHITENILSRYLCPSLVEEISSGKRHCDFKPADKSITVIFTDIKDFTKHAERLGSEKISALLNEYLDHMIQIVFDFGGTIDKIIGDALMVFFGAPNEMDKSEQANKACQCALAMQEDLRKLNEKWSVDYNTQIATRIGIHFGDAMVGNYGNKQRSDYTAIGHTINIASRIESVCTPNKVFVSTEVAELITEVEVIEVGSFNLKGIGDNVLLFELKEADTSSKEQGDIAS